ncbi:hypothetical protein DL93DRAFT_2076660 [Clavulina sp. PMI_390]|nr:hypothetical protein DL93DRAFT_2076660 [Clavulina sp. PMI_390]
MLNKAITTFNLVDPGTRQPFAPYVPIPLNAVPQQPDWASWQASEQWKAQLITRYTGFRQQQLQKRAQRNQMIGGAVKLAGSALGNFVGTH